VEFGVGGVAVEAGRGVWIRSRRENERGRGLELVLQRRLFGRAARHGRAVGACRVDGLEIVLCEQMERAEEFVVLEVEGAGGLEVSLEGGDVGRLYDELLGGADLSELLVALGGRDPRRPPRSAMVGVGVGVEVCRMVLLCVVEVLRHG